MVSHQVKAYTMARTHTKGSDQSVPTRGLIISRCSQGEKKFKR